MPVLAVDGLHIIAGKHQLRRNRPARADMLLPEAMHMTDDAHAPGDHRDVAIRRPAKRQYRITRIGRGWRVTVDDQYAVTLNVIVNNALRAVVRQHESDACAIRRPDKLRHA